MRAPLRTLNLNLDFHDSPGPGCWGNDTKVARFRSPFEERGKALAAVLRERLPLLERFSLLFHGTDESVWIPFIPMERPDRRLWYQNIYKHV